ncbi:hypothetical protein [Schumannella sp. 10F1B-5-1]|uniref:hypothetical protein n=1 Tax=Schumannella sp. 10F1B-5-1 TaxID=2590780 RepID=UPI00113207BA|nr:hypothetical protein [Schumannella sp. 10F1B-5-1]TPW73191.1 hypothetical protein FJ658_08125 [Schumannella sp. 10F1B-5-1]
MNVANAAPDEAKALESTATAAVPDHVEDPGAALTLASAGRGTVAASDTSAVSLPATADGTIALSAIDGGNLVSTGLTIGLPDNAAYGSARTTPTSASYEGDRASSVAQPFADGLRISTIIQNAESPGSYSYALPEDITPVLLADGSVKLAATFVGEAADESVTIEFGTVAPAWATDAKGNAVPTHYEVDKGELRQVVDFTADTAFPVVADPTFWWGWNAFVSNSVHHKLANLLAIGAGTAAVAAVLVGLIPNAYVQTASKMAVAMIGVGVALFNGCNANGRGVILGWTYLAGGIPPQLAPWWVRQGYFCLPQ